MPDLGLADDACWLLEGEGDGRAEQLEGAALDGRRFGEFLDSLPGEGDALAVQRGKVIEEILVFADGQAVTVVLAGVFCFYLR